MRFIDLFAGIGGFRLAFESLGNNCVFSSEIDKDCQKIYFDNFGDVPAGDITKINEYDVPNFDILAAGFPCQPFSYAGKLEGFEDKTRGTLFFDVARIIKAKEPKMFLLENVKGITTHNKGKTIETIRAVLEDDLGYDIHMAVLNSRDYGVPQDRKRWYCVGFKEPRDFSFPKPTKRNATLREIIDFEEDDPKLKLTKFENDRIDYHFKMMSPNYQRVEHDSSAYAPTSKKGKYGIYSYLKPDGSLRFHVGDYAKTQIQEAYYCGTDSFSPAIIAARSPKLLELRRKLSVKECKRLQGFPDDFQMNEINSKAFHQLGNSVTVTVIKMIAEQMMSSWKNKKKKSSQKTINEF